MSGHIQKEEFLKIGLFLHFTNTGKAGHARNVERCKTDLLK